MFAAGAFGIAVRHAPGHRHSLQTGREQPVFRKKLGRRQSVFTNSPFQKEPADADSQKAAILKAIELLKDKKSKSQTVEKRKKFLQDHIDPATFLVWFIENYPESKKIMKENPDYQYNFK